MVHTKIYGKVWQIYRMVWSIRIFLEKYGKPTVWYGPYEDLWKSMANLPHGMVHTNIFGKVWQTYRMVWSIRRFMEKYGKPTVWYGPYEEA